MTAGRPLLMESSPLKRLVLLSCPVIFLSIAFCAPFGNDELTTIAYRCREEPWKYRKVWMRKAHTAVRSRCRSSISSLIPIRVDLCARLRSKPFPRRRPEREPGLRGGGLSPRTRARTTLHRPPARGGGGAQRGRAAAALPSGVKGRGPGRGHRGAGLRCLYPRNYGIADAQRASIAWSSSLFSKPLII